MYPTPSKSLILSKIFASPFLIRVAWRLLILRLGLIRDEAANITVLRIPDDFDHKHETKKST